MEPELSPCDCYMQSNQKRKKQVHNDNSFVGHIVSTQKIFNNNYQTQTWQIFDSSSDQRSQRQLVQWHSTTHCWTTKAKQRNINGLNSPKYM